MTAAGGKRKLKGMDGSNMVPYQDYGGGGSSTKVFFLIALLLFLFVFIASSSLAAVDLTPDSVVISTQAVPVTGASDGSTVVVIQDVAGQPVQNIPAVHYAPVQCSDPYIVQSGDSLSAIANACSTTVAELRMLNPEIRSADLIYTGQVLRTLPGANVPVTGEQPAPTAVPTNPPQLILPVQGTQVAPGTEMQVRGIDFPANTPLYVAIGPQRVGYSIVASAVSDGSGSVITTIIVPAAADPNEPWVVVVTTTTLPQIQAASQPFVIR